MLKIDINIIENKEGRNDKLLPLFTSMSKQNYGKLVENAYYCVNTTLQLTHTNNEEEFLFNTIQMNSVNRGIETNMFIIRKEENNV